MVRQNLASSPAAGSVDASRHVRPGSKAAIRTGGDDFCSGPESRPAAALRQPTQWAKRRHAGYYSINSSPCFYRHRSTASNSRFRSTPVTFPVVWDWATLASSSSVRPMMHTPVQQLHVLANTLPPSSPRDRYVFATASGPQREPFDCQSTCLWNVAATGSCHARFMGSGVRVADEAMT